MEYQRQAKPSIHWPLTITDHQHHPTTIRDYQRHSKPSINYHWLSQTISTIQQPSGTTRYIQTLPSTTTIQQPSGTTRDIQTLPSTTTDYHWPSAPSNNHQGLPETFEPFHQLPLTITDHQHHSTTIRLRLMDSLPWKNQELCSMLPAAIIVCRWHSETSSWVNIGWHTKNQLPGISRSGWKPFYILYWLCQLWSHWRLPCTYWTVLVYPIILCYCTTHGPNKFCRGESESANQWQWLTYVHDMNTNFMKVWLL